MIRLPNKQTEYDTCGITETHIFFVSKMLSPAQKNLSEEDSSGSDTGSGVEPETDRFGFILTSRSTAGWEVSYLLMNFVLLLSLVLLRCFTAIQKFKKEVSINSPSDDRKSFLELYG